MDVCMDGWIQHHHWAIPSYHLPCAEQPARSATPEHCHLAAMEMNCFLIIFLAEVNYAGTSLNRYIFWYAILDLFRHRFLSFFFFIIKLYKNKSVIRVGTLWHMHSAFTCWTCWLHSSRRRLTQQRWMRILETRVLEFTRSYFRGNSRKTLWWRGDPPLSVTSWQWTGHPRQCLPPLIYFDLCWRTRNLLWCHTH